MLRIALGVIVIIHALLHLMGFAKAFNLAKLKELSHPPILALSEAQLKLTGVLWLVACLLLVWASVAFMLKGDVWLWPGMAGIILSQLLVILHWHDTKGGTVANLIMLLIWLPAYATLAWKENAEKAGNLLLSGASLQNLPVVQAQQLQHLPMPVQQWLQASGIVGKPEIETMLSHQIATMQIKPGGDNMQVKATQYNRISVPGFAWQVRVSMMPSVYMLGLDRYEGGHGYMQIKLLGLYSLTNAMARK